MSTRFEFGDLQFGEGPRWHDGALWCSDMFGHRVLRYRQGHEVEEVVRMPFDNPSGLGWLPSGELLVVAMQTQAIYRLGHDGALVLHAEVSSLSGGMANDMVVAGDGTAFVDDSGLPRFGRSGTRVPGRVLAVYPDGTAVAVATDLEGPNGIVLSPDGSTLIVAESFGGRLVAFDVGSAGILSNRRVHAELPASGEPVHPDGICIDADGGVWLADLTYRQVMRVDPAGLLTDTISFDPLIPIACALGGDDGRRLFVCLSEHTDISRLGTAPVSQVRSVEVAVPGVVNA